jgi:hypothetical protein
MAGAHGITVHPRPDFLPKLKTVGLEWANFQVMRRTHSCLLRQRGARLQPHYEGKGKATMQEKTYLQVNLSL